MAAKQNLFNDLQNVVIDEEAERILIQADSLFHSEEVNREVRWRLAALKEIAANPELADVTEGLRHRLSEIFASGGGEEEVLGNLKGLTEIQRKDGGTIELRRFLKRDRRTLSSAEYREMLNKKLQNTEYMANNLLLFFPDERDTIRQLADLLRKLGREVVGGMLSTQTLKTDEEALRQTPPFEAYEALKTRFLRDWLGRFSTLTGEQIEGLTPDQVQELVIEHQRHQITKLLKTEIAPVGLDMSGRLGIHDTLECGFKNESFWSGANISAKNGFRQWILTVIQTFGMLEGKRYACFRMKGEDEQFLLFGLGINELPEDKDTLLELVPYVKPFVRKGGYLLEVRQRDIGDPEQYNHELRHYVLPFIFAFDQVRNFNVNQDLITFFTSGY